MAWRNQNVSGRNEMVILIVEDEPLVRLAALDTAENAGYSVLEACDADEAIILLELHPEIRIVFTDIEMPGSIDGMKLAAFIRNRWPPVKIIITSGRVLAKSETLPEHAVFLPKPYRSSELTDHLNLMAA